MFLVGFLTLRVESLAAIIATVTTTLSIAGWLLMRTPWADKVLPSLAQKMPDSFWVSTFANLIMFGVAYVVSVFIRPHHDRDIHKLTIWGERN